MEHTAGPILEIGVVLLAAVLAGWLARRAGLPAIGRAPKDLSIPDGCSLFAVIRDGVATPLRPDTVMLEGDKVIAIGKQECQDLLHDQLIGNPDAMETRTR